MKTLRTLAPALLLALLPACGESEAREVEIPTVEEARTEATQADRAELEERIAEFEDAIQDLSQDLQEQAAKLKDMDPGELLDKGAAEVKQITQRLEQDVKQLNEVVQVYREELQRKLE